VPGRGAGSGAAGNGGEEGHLDSLGDDRVGQVADVGVADEDVDVGPHRARLVPDAAADGGVGGGEGIEDGPDGDG